MYSAGGSRTARKEDAPSHLLGAIGSFLADQRLELNPTNFTFAWHVLAEPEGALAQAVRALTDGGVRLTQRDLDTLDADVDTETQGQRARADHLVARTQMQVEGFEDMMADLREHTQGFGRDLAATAEMLVREHGAAPLEEIARLTATMLERVGKAESELARATHEASALRAELESARDDARRDPLTNLPNRRAFEEAFKQHADAGATIIVGMCDVDHFKTVNDRFGHAVGDRVLRSIAEVLRESFDGHLTARYGGEEFIVLFIDTPIEMATAALETARAAVEAKRFRVRETDAPLGTVTISAGVSDGTGKQIGTAVQRADRLLYQAKSEGRNRILAG